MFTRRILALAAALFAALIIAGTTGAHAATMASPAYHYTVDAAGLSHSLTGTVPHTRWR